VKHGERLKKHIKLESSARLVFPTFKSLVDYRDGKLFRYVVMEKRTGWGAEYASAKRNGEWEYQAFNADRSVNEKDDVDRCFACHKSEVQRDYVFTLERMKDAR